MSSTNKLNLKDYKLPQPPNHQSQYNYPNNQIQQKPLNNQRRPSNRQSKKLKLNTLPCEQVQKEGEQIFLYKSAWEDDMEHFQMKGCTSPTFATQILSHANNHSSLFPYTDQVNQNQEESIKRTRVSNSRSKSKHNKSLQKFIGDSVSTHRPSKSTVEKTMTISQNQPPFNNLNNQQQAYMYELKKLQSMTNELRRQNKKLDDKCKQLKQRCQQLQQINSRKRDQNPDNLMSHEQLLQRMKNDSFWKFYLKAQKMIKASMAQNNQQSFASPINFMKQLQALREMTSKMKKDNSALKKLGEQKSEQVESMKDKLSVQQAEVQQMRLKCVAYESSIMRLKQQLSKNSKQLQKLSNLSTLQQKLTQKVMESANLSKQVSLLSSQLEQLKILNSECERQRLSTKKKCKELNDQNQSLNKQLSAIKTSYNLLEIEKQELSANKKQLIQKQRLKERVFQLEKEKKSLLEAKEQEISRMKTQCEVRWGKEIEVKESRVKELDEKVEMILGNISELQTQNTIYSQENKRLNHDMNTINKENNRLMNENKQLKKQLKELQEENSHNQQQLQSIRTQHQTKINELSQNLKNLTLKLNEQGQSLLNQEKLIQQLKRQVNQKDQLLRAKQYESQKLKASLGMIKEQQQSSRAHQSRLHAKTKLSQSQTNIRADLQQQKAHLQQKLNQALQMYEQVHNQKVQLQLQLQYAEQQVQKLTIQLQQLQSSGINGNQQCSAPNNHNPSEDTLQMVENLLTIKEEIIKKILIFCPQDYKALLIQYIYYGDMIKEKYFQIINIQLQNRANIEQEEQNYHQTHEHQTSQDQSYLQPDQSNFYPHSHTTRHLHHSNSQYNKTKPYQSRNPHYQDDSSQPQSQSQSLPDPHNQQEEINFLVEEFLKIGKIIDDETRIHYQNHKSKDRKKLISKDKQRQKEEQDFRKSKQKEIQQSKNLLHQLNRKIQKVKQNNINNENSFNYQPASHLQKKPISKLHKNFIQDQKYPSEPIQRVNRQPLQQNEDKNQSNISRPLFTSNDIKIKNPSMRANYQEQRQIREQNSMQRSSMMGIQQTPYQKGSQGQTLSGRDNFNHGVMSKLNMMKISDRIRQ